jgi:hypothetical protein
MPAKSGNLGVFQPIVGPWYDSLENPAKSQDEVLSQLVKKYDKTRYGKSHKASEVRDIADFRSSFPVLSYGELEPYLTQVRKGDYEAILPEQLVCWVMTRGTTGAAKVLPVTREHLGQILACGARAFINYAIKKKDVEILNGRILNLNFPSEVYEVRAEDKSMSYGYSSGTYAKLIPAFGDVSLVPAQQEIDKLGPGIKKLDWHNRFELVFKRARGESVKAAMGVTPVILAFARYVNEKYGKNPKDFWNLKALFCTSVKKIQFKYAPILRKYFGDIAVVEMYSATEGVFAQQIDDLPYITPNYDKYLFEVQTGQKLKMLHELKRGEWGSLIISSCLFPRYDIGDVIESAGKNYYRVFGRRKLSTILEHRLYRLLFRSFL